MARFGLLVMKSIFQKKSIKILLTILLALFIALLFSLVLSLHALSVSRYELSSPKISQPIRIVQLTDLHNSEFGKGNARLIRKVREEKPDLILLTGDMLNQYEERTDIPVALIRELSRIAPVCASYGNHETQHEISFGSDLRETFTEAGAAVLDSDWVDVEIRGQALRIGGIYGYCLPGDSGEDSKTESRFLTEYQATDRTKLLLCHMPVCWIRNGSLDYWDVDLIFAGHAHGGQVRIPFFGGLVAPDQGWLPGRCEGLFFSKDGSHTMALSRGLGTSRGKLPRLNNIPEILVLQLNPA